MQLLITIANLFIVATVTAVLVVTHEIYYILRASSIRTLMAAWSYLLLWRIIVTFDQADGVNSTLQSYATWFLLPFWPLVAIGMWKLMKSLRNPLTKDKI